MDTQLPHPQTHIMHLMCGPEHETRQRDVPITQLSQNGHFTFLEEHSRSSSVYDEIVESYSDTRRKSHHESHSSTVRNVASQPALRREQWSTAGVQSRNRPPCPRPPPRTGPFFDAFRQQEDMGHLRPPPLSVSRPVETTRRQGRPRSSSVPLPTPHQTPILTLFPRIDPVPTSTLKAKPSYPGSELSSASHYPPSSTAVSVSTTNLLTTAPPLPPKDIPLRPFRPLRPPVVPRKDTPSLPPLKIPSQNPSSTGEVLMSMRNPIKGPALYTQPRPLPTPTPTPTPTPAPTPCRHQRKAMRLNTPYMQMLLALDKIPRLHNILVSYFTWLLLVAFIIVTGSFTSESGSGSGLHIMQPLSIASLSCMALGILGCLWLGIRWRRNYVWLINRLYMPLFLNGLAGVLATLASVYAQHEGRWCFSAVVAVGVEGVLVVVAVVLFGVYNFWLLRRVRKFESGYYGKGRKLMGEDVDGGVQEEGVKSVKSGGWWNGRMNAPPCAPGSVV